MDAENSRDTRPSNFRGGCALSRRCLGGFRRAPGLIEIDYDRRGRFSLAMRCVCQFNFVRRQAAEAVGGSDGALHGNSRLKLARCLLSVLALALRGNPRLSHGILGDNS